MLVSPRLTSRSTPSRKSPACLKPSNTCVLTLTIWSNASIAMAIPFFFNTNICRTNIEDVKQLVEIAHDNGISLTFHVNEAPMMEQSHFKHLHENDTYISTQTFSMVDDLLDWLIDKQRPAHKMVDSLP